MNVTEVKEKIWSVHENWDKLKPYLNDKDVQKVLDEAMISFCEEYPSKYQKMWETGNAPWEYTTSSFWHDRIFDMVQDDEEFQKEQFELFQKFHKAYSDVDEEDLWDELLDTDEYRALDEKFYNKHSPKKSTIEYYQFFHGCHWINVFTAKLIEKALNVETDIWQTETHTVVEFVKDDVCYCADILIEWETPEELCKFMYQNIES
ncbi:hypothetical protein BW899_06645 [Bacillus mycoides]|nr:hypothetical protein BW899_06645 [Bacillus mycoides]HDR7585528.1 hypothetical protein [Bacillus mycoides]